MGITITKIKDADYFRITKNWDNNKIKEQRYVRVPASEKNKLLALKKAESINELLSQRQNAYHNLIRNNGQIYFARNGKIVGINRVYSRTGRSYVTYEHIFKIRFNIGKNRLGDSRTRYTSVNIDTHGFDRAWELAIDKYCFFGDIENKLIKNLLLQSKKYYQFDPTLKENIGKKPHLPILKNKLKIDYSDAKAKTSKTDLFDIEQKLQNEIDSFIKNFGN